MLVKAAAAGIDISSIVNGLNQPIGPARCQLLIQKSLDLCGEVRSLGGLLVDALDESLVGNHRERFAGKPLRTVAGGNHPQ